MAKLDILAKQLNPKFTKKNETLAPYTSLKIGGPADMLFEAHSINDLKQATKLAKLQNIPITLLGRGSNVLISDRGIKGLVIINKAKNIKIKGEKGVNEDRVEGLSAINTVNARWQADKEKGTFKYEFKDLDYDETDSPRIEVTMESGVDLPFAINYLIGEGITGLQWYSGIPGTIGGAIFNNVHGGTHFINEVLKSVKVLNEDFNETEIKSEDLEFDYDKSRFHKNKDIILEGTFELFKGDTEKAKAVVQEWAKRKQIQPKNSPGCTFANISNKTMDDWGFPTTSVGYIVEHILKMSEFSIGDAEVSTAHHNFIVNKGNATAKDYLTVIKEIIKRTKEELDIKLVPEIFLLGFSDKELEDIF